MQAAAQQGYLQMEALIMKEVRYVHREINNCKLDIGGKRGESIFLLCIC